MGIAVGLRGPQVDLEVPKAFIGCKTNDTELFPLIRIRPKLNQNYWKPRVEK